MASTDRPMVGVGVLIFKDGKVLLGERRGSHGAGEYSTPGGHLEWMEGYEECGRRETREETGIEIDNVRFQFLSNVKEYAPKHYVHIGLIADWLAGEPSAMEPKECAEWRWYSLDGLPEPLFEPTRQAIEAHKTGQVFFDAVVPAKRKR